MRIRTREPVKAVGDLAHRGRSSRWRGVIVNAGVVCVSLFGFLLLCEFVLFRWVLLASDIPSNAYIDGVIRLTPGQTGTFRLRNDLAAPFAINRQGWNSGHGDYRRERTPGRARIAIIGDSFVEALNVPVTASLAEQLEQRLGTDVEVYRFGISGAPLSHYLYMLEREVLRYTPDLVVLVLVHNDFDQSFRFKPGRYTSSFMKLALVDGRVLAEIPPQPYVASGWDALRTTATLRYLYYRWQIRPAALKWLLFGRGQRYEANVDVADVRAHQDNIWIATDYLFGRLAALAAERGFRLLLVMDGSRAAVYRDAPAATDGALGLNAMAGHLAEAHRLPFIDLHPHFVEAWAETGERFDFPSDYHWNEHGHAVAARAIEHWVRGHAPLIVPGGGDPPP